MGFAPAVAETQGNLRKAVSSPRAWGCTEVAAPVGGADEIIPTRVGVHRCARVVGLGRLHHPHARGGAPPSPQRHEFLQRSSPRAWGCTGIWPSRRIRQGIIPTRVGVHRTCRGVIH